GAAADPVVEFPVGGEGPGLGVGAWTWPSVVPAPGPPDVDGAVVDRPVAAPGAPVLPAAPPRPLAPPAVPLPVDPPVCAYVSDALAQSSITAARDTFLRCMIVLRDC